MHKTVQKRRMKIFHVTLLFCCNHRHNIQVTFVDWTLMLTIAFVFKDLDMLTVIEKHSNTKEQLVITLMTNN